MNRVSNICFVVAALLSLSGCTTKQAYVAKGNQYLKEGKDADAVINYRKAIQKDPLSGEAYYGLGLTFIRQADPKQAYFALSRAVELLPDNDEAKERLGELCISGYLRDPRHPLNLYNQIKDLAGKLLAKNPNSFQGLRLTGYLALEDRKPEEAIAMFRRALQVRPDDGSLTTFLAQILRHNSHAQEAETLALGFISQHKDYGPMYDALYDWYVSTNQTAEAENILKTKANNNPRQADYIEQLAMHYYRLNKSAEVDSTLHRILDNPKDFPEGRQRIGDFYMKVRNYPAALQSYEEAVRANPKDNIGVLRKVTDALLAQGKNEEASGVIEQILKQDPKDDPSLQLRAILRMQSGKPENLDKARRELEGLSGMHPEDASLWFELGRASRLKGDQETARKQLQEAVNRRKNFVEARFELAAIDLSLHRPKEALEQATAILSLRPNDPRARLLRAVALIRTENQTQARAELTQLTKEFPQWSEPKLELGMLYMADKKYKEAREVLAKVSGNDPRRIAGVAAAASSEGQFDKAIGVLNEALKKSPDSVMFRQQLANTEVAAGHYDLGIAEFRKMLAGNPQSAQLRVSLAGVYELKGDYNAAVAFYQEAQALSPKDPGLTFSLGVALGRAGRASEAKIQYENVLKLYPDHADAMNNLAFLLSETGGDLDEALNLAHRAMQKFPKEPNFADTVGYVYLKKRMRDSALQTFANLVQKYPKVPVFRYHLGMALLETGDKVRARKELEKALASSPSNDEAAKIRELVNKIG